MIFSRRGAFSTFLGPKGKPGPTEGKELRGQRGYEEHMQEFLSSIRTRKQAKANAQTAHYSCAIVHLGNIAFETRDVWTSIPRMKNSLIAMRPMPC